MATEYMKKCSTSLALEEMQIKHSDSTSLPIRIATTKNINKKQMLARIWEKRNPHTLLVGI
jgi:hypothetical protein